MVDQSHPRDNLVRAVYPGGELREDDDADDGLGRLTGYFSIFDNWYEVDSIFEGRFMERIAPGAFADTIAQDRAEMRALFQHGMDPQAGDKPLGPIDVLEEDKRGPRYEVWPLLDTSYNRDLLPGLRAGLYGSSFRFSVQGEEWDNEPKRSKSNPEALPERTITKARVFEFGPVTFPANPAATAGVRSLTDRFRAAEAPPPEAAPAPAPARKETIVTAPAAPPPETDALDEYRTVSEMEGAIEERQGILTSIHNDHSGRELPADVQAEWDRATSEVERLRARIAADEQRRAQLASLAERQVSEEPGDGGTPTFHAPTLVRSRTDVEVHDVTHLRGISRSDEEYHGLLRDNAMRAVERSSIAHPQADQDGARGHIAYLLDHKDSKDKELARRILVTGTPVYKRAFDKYIKGQSLSAEEQRAAALAVGVDSTGGFAVPFAFDPTIIATGAHTSINPYRAACRVETIVGTDTWRGVSAGAVAVSYEAEAAAETEAGPTFAQPELIVKRLSGFVTTSIEMMQDRADLAAELAVLFQEGKDTYEEQQFSIGAGTTVFPLGISTDGAYTEVTSATIDVIAVADLDATEAAVPIRHRANAVWFMSRAAIRTFQGFETVHGKYFNGVNYAAVGNPAINPGGNTGLKLLGYPVYEAPSYPWTPTTSDTSVAWLGDPKRYLIVDRAGMNVEVIPHMLNGATPSFPTGQRGVFAMWRNTARPLDVNSGRQLVVQ